MINESYNREKILETISSLQDSFFEKLEEYDLEESLHPGSERSKQLYRECKELAGESERLIDQL